VSTIPLLEITIEILSAPLDGWKKRVFSNVRSTNFQGISSKNGISATYKVNRII
jgi:hypothetical protein